ncbi:ATP-binding protein [Candidatus Saccharibacteria bacterium]|nr:ATP-binding protein [Candidatus Saccharibacteria bacterium]
MTALLTIFVLLLIAAAVVGPIVFMQVRKTRRRLKNFERSLKMVPMLIHLPPPSDDIESNGRDVRDVVDETISKAQIIYNIIASTLQKGFKGKFYGQRHFGFEIVGVQGFIYYYATVPVSLVDVVKQAVNSAYPTARLEEVVEHNIFNKVGKLNAVAGGELNLKESYAYPIATYQDMKRDAMQSLLNALSGLGKEDGVAIQILLRPADPAWRKVASGVASNKRKGQKSGAGDWAKSFATALNKPPEHNAKDGPKDKPELSNMEQQTLDAIDEKTKYPGYETLIRVVASSNVVHQSQTILNSVVSSFSLYDLPGKNGFKFTPAKDSQKLVSNYIMRLFPQSKKSNILNAVELATLFHFPDQSNIPTSQVVRQESKQVDGPRNIPEEGMLLGYNVFRGAKKPIRLALQDRQRHMYVVGQTGTGKSTYLENLALQDMLNGNGFAFVDPHGDTAEKLLAMVPKERTEDLIYFCPSDMDYPMGVNLFEFENADQKDFLIQEALNMLQKLYDPNHQGMMGPRYEHMFRQAALTIMADPAGGTFVDIPKLFRDPAYVKQKLSYVKDPNVLEFWQKEMPQAQRSNEFGEVVSWFVSKFGAFLSNEMMRNIIGQTKSSFDLRDIMDNKKILLVNLSKGRTGDLNSKLLGMIFVMKFQAAAMSRASIPEDERVDFSLYVDEFQNFSTDSFATIMSEARKYHLNLIVANQFTTQLTEEIRDAVFGNIGTIVAFRIGQNDVESLGRYFQPTFDADDLLRVPNYNTIVRTLVGGVPTQPFSMATLPPLGSPNAKLADALKQFSAAKYGRPKAQVEAEIFERMATKSGAPGFGSAGATVPSASPWQAAGANAPAKPAAPSVGPGTFLDNWLTKKGTAAANPAPQAAQTSSAPVLSSPAPVNPTAAQTVASPTGAAGPQIVGHGGGNLAAAQAPAPLAAAEPLPPGLTPLAPPSQAAAPLDTPHEAEIPLKTTGHNISSDAVDQAEISKIADELKAGLGRPAPEEQPPAGTTDANVKPPAVAKSAAEEGDTILIDKDGNFKAAG